MTFLTLWENPLQAINERGRKVEYDIMHTFLPADFFFFATSAQTMLNAAGRLRIAKRR